MGHIPDGVYNFVGKTIEILSAPQRTIDEISRLSAILRNAQEKKQSPEAAAESIRKELPELSGLTDILPKTRTELYAFLTLIATVITLIYQLGGRSEKTPNITVNQTINQVFIETERSAKSPGKTAQAPKKAKPKVGRNEPCPCGSGKKFKKCCVTKE